MAGAWIAAGVALAAVAVLEAAARLTARAPARSAATEPAPPDDVLAQVRRDQARRTAVVDPYRGEWSRPLSTRFVNIDSAGRRVTPQPPAEPGAPAVLMLGGSEMWGANTPDSATIPALVAAALRARGAGPHAVVNLAQPGFTAMQSAMTLLVRLALGDTPRVVVALDGYADLAVAARHGDPGRTLRDADYQRRLELGQRGFGAELLGLPRHSAVLGPLLGRPRDAADASGPAPCATVARHYANVVGELEGLARTFGFRLLVFRAPPPGAAAERNTDGRAAPADLGRCAAAVDSALAGRPEAHRLADSLGAAPALGPDGELVLAPASYPAIADRIASEIVAAVAEPGTGGR